MNQETLLKNLKLLKKLEVGGSPARSWRQKNREIFLMQVRNSRANLTVKKVVSWQEQAAVYSRMFFGSAWVRRNVFRPAIIGLSSIAVMLSGWIASVNASINSVPGDILYPLKRATEAAQLTLTAGTENKTTLQVEFATRRLDEVSKITEDPGASKNSANVQYAVQEFKDNINDVKNNLDALKESASPATVAAVAALVNTKTALYATQLTQAADVAPESVKLNLESAKNAAEEAGVKAVEVMVSHTTSVTSAEELKQKLEEKITQLESRVSLSALKPAASSTISALDSADAKKSLDAARTLIASGNLLGALQEVKSASKIILGDTAATSTTPVVNSATSTNPAVLNNTTVRSVQPGTTSTDGNTEVKIQFIPDSTSLDWLEAQIMSQDFRINDRPAEQEDISTITK